MDGLYQHVDIEQMCREMHGYAYRVLIDEPENPFENCYGVTYKYTIFRTSIGLGPLSLSPEYEVARLFKETLNEARKKLNGARVLEIRLKHAEIPQVVLVGDAKPTHRLQKPPVEPVPVSVKPSRQLTD